MAWTILGYVFYGVLATSWLVIFVWSIIDLIADWRGTMRTYVIGWDDDGNPCAWDTRMPTLWQYLRSNNWNWGTILIFFVWLIFLIIFWIIA